MTNIIQFPGLGLQFEINRVAFSIGGLAIYWYGIILATGLLLGVLFTFHYAPDFGVDVDRFIDVLCVGTVMAIVCARIYYVTFVPYHYSSIWEMLDIRDGGIAMYGSLIGAFLFGGLACKWRKIPLLPTFDMVAIGFLIGQGVGRWGNFVNQEAFGTNTTLPWGMISEATQRYLSANQALLAEEGITVDPSLPVHPTFLYESIWCFIGLALLWRFMKKRRFNGEVFVWYLIWNGTGRFWIEGLRTDSLMFSVEMNLRTSQVIAFVMVVFGLVTDFVMRRRVKGTQLMVPLALTGKAMKKLGKMPMNAEWVTELPATESHQTFVTATEMLNRQILEDTTEQETEGAENGSED